MVDAVATSGGIPATAIQLTNPRIMDAAPDNGPKRLRKRFTGGLHFQPAAESHTPLRPAMLARAPRSDKVLPNRALRRLGYLNGPPRWRIITIWH